MKILFILLVFPLLARAVAPLEFSEEELNPPAEEVLIKKPEKYLRNESMIYDLNTTLGIKDQRRYTGEDKNRFSMAAHVAGDYEHFSEILGVELAYMRRTERYNKIWWGGQFFQHQAYFGQITQNPTVGGLNSDASFPRHGDVKNSVRGFGPGVGYRFKLLLDFFETEDVFESVDVFVNMIELNETFLKEKYQGWGLSTNYGIHKRSSTSYFYGGKFSYNVSQVVRGPRGEESKNERSLTLGWLTLAFEMGFFF